MAMNDVMPDNDLANENNQMENISEKTDTIKLVQGFKHVIE